LEYLWSKKKEDDCKQKYLALSLEDRARVERLVDAIYQASIVKGRAKQ
jgi:hypothetical protein